MRRVDVRGGVYSPLPIGDVTSGHQGPATWQVNTLQLSHLGVSQSGYRRCRSLRCDLEVRDGGRSRRDLLRTIISSKIRSWEFG